MNTEAHDQRLANLERRLDETDRERQAQRNKLDEIDKILAELRADLARIEGIVTEMRWTNRFILALVLLNTVGLVQIVFQLLP